MPRGEAFWNPYRWVPAGAGAIDRQAPLYQQRLQGVAGRLHCSLEALTPLLINDGRGAFVRSQRTGQPYLPATSLKGLIRSLAELVGNAAAPFPHSGVDPDHQAAAAAAVSHGEWQLDVAARVFGYLQGGRVFAGLVRFSDGHPSAAVPAALRFRVAGGTPDPGHRPFYPSNKLRKVYHHKAGARELTPPHAGIRADQQRQVYPLPAGVRFAFTADFHNLREAELALLLYCLVLEEEVTVTLRPEALTPQHHEPVTLTGPLRHKLGYGKPQGGGSVHIRVEGMELRTDPKSRYRGGAAAAGWRLEGDLLREELRRRTRAYVTRTDDTLRQLRAMLLYAPGDPRAANLNYPSYGWFQQDKQHPPGTPLKPVL
jgi:hypothetical protein